MKEHHTKSMLMRHPTGCGHMSEVSLFIHSYLLDSSTWSQCIEPKHAVEWNVSLFSILLALGGIEFILCLFQIINGVLGGICGYCCSRQQVRTCVKMHHSFHPREKSQHQTLLQLPVFIPFLWHSIYSIQFCTQ